MTSSNGHLHLDGKMAVRNVLATTIWRNRRVTLVHSTSGWEPAGSGMRRTAEKWGVLWVEGGAGQGRWYNTEAKARAELDRFMADEERRATV